MQTRWQTTRFSIDLSAPVLMGILNVTPDSFSDGGRFLAPADALKQAEQLVRDGAGILDVGAESTRPGAPPLPLQDELERLVPVLRELVKWQVPVSVDTYKPEVMQACLDLGVDIINDVWALRREGVQGLTGEAVVAQHGRCGVCLMHMHLEPQTMQIAPMEGDAVPAVTAFLAERAGRLRALGVDPSRLVLDYGIGFGKTVAQNFALLARQRDILALGYPLLVGWSRKSSLGQVTGRTSAPDRVLASVTAAVLAAERGARVLRVHDVAATAEALKVWQAMTEQEG
ncbi:dihydropteroate synthase [Tepidicella baoligensis]|uniref:dihydropteroate synthase n=1 Tax=Tepidicella baoligensis TaxID=2707016 RepID=UPI0015DA9AFA|nr:dihydropteroate synthase [Tepidicella baoligensis]